MPLAQCKRAMMGLTFFYLVVCLFFLICNSVL